jgi:DNA-binding CsgD family transcriptional regulator
MRGGFGVGLGPTQGGLEAHEEIVEAVGHLELPIILVDLTDFTVKAVSNAAVNQLGRALGSMVGHPVIELLAAEDRPTGLNAISAMRNGLIDFFSNHRLRMAEDVTPLVRSWVRAVRFGDKPYALAEIAADSGPRLSPLVDYLDHEPVTMAIGLVDSAWVITAVSTEVSVLLGVAPDDFVGRVMLGAIDRDDVARLLEVDARSRTTSSVAMNLRFRDGSGSWVMLCCLLTSLAGSAERCFMLLPPAAHEAGPGAAGRVARLEDHLRRIAAEVTASGILFEVGQPPDTSRFPQLRSLSLRQWEVLSRLLRGERVPTIASALAISPSTVRNHLSVIFSRFGVHSQAELVALLGSHD